MDTLTLWIFCIHPYALLLKRCSYDSLSAVVTCPPWTYLNGIHLPKTVYTPDSPLLNWIFPGYYNFVHKMWCCELKGSSKSVCLLHYNHTIQCHLEKDEYPLESGSSQGIFLMPLLIASGLLYSDSYKATYSKCLL